MKISAVYKIINTVTGDFYIGSSKNIKHRWADHKCPSKWNEHPNNPMYLDMRKYGTDKFAFEILEVVEESFLKEKEQQFIETLKPSYNQMNAKGLDIERFKESHKSDKFKKSHKKACNKYNNQLCIYNGETLTLNALSNRFWRQGIPHPAKEAKKFIIKR